MNLRKFAIFQCLTLAAVISYCAANTREWQPKKVITRDELKEMMAGNHPLDMLNYSVLPPARMMRHNPTGVQLQEMQRDQMIRQPGSNFFKVTMLLRRADFLEKRASYFRCRKNLKAAIADYKELIKLEPTNAIAYSDLAGALCEQGNLQGAIDAHTAHLKIDPKDYFEMEDRASIYMQLKDYKNAETDLTDTIAEYSSAKAFTDRAIARISLGKLAQAKCDAIEAAKCDDANFYTWNTLAMIEQIEGKTQDAIKSYSKSIESYPEEAQAYARRAKLRHFEGDEMGAKADLAKYNDLKLAEKLETDLVIAKANPKITEDLPSTANGAAGSSSWYLYGLTHNVFNFLENHFFH